MVSVRSPGGQREREKEMKYWRIGYYKTRNFINNKYIKDKCAQGAIKKARVKHITDVVELTEEEYKAALARRYAIGG